MHMHLCKNYQALNIMSYTQVIRAQKDDGFPLVVNEHVGVSSLKLVDKLDEVAVTVLSKVLGAQVRQLIPAFDVVDANLALLNQFLHEKIPQGDELCARTIGVFAADVLLVYSSRLPKLSSSPSSNIVLEQNTSSLIVRAAATSSASIVNCAVGLCSPPLKLIGTLASITMYDDVDLPLSWLLPQLAP